MRPIAPNRRDTDCDRIGSLPVRGTQLAAEPALLQPRPKVISDAKPDGIA